MTDTKPTNPKDLIGSDKLPLHLWPTTASALGALALLDGAMKYGRSNWRHAGVRPSIYVDAAQRHLLAWFEGEDNDPDSGLPHLGHALACLAILVDAQAAGKMNDDRQTAGGHRALLDSLTPHVARVKARYADREAPKHYTIEDMVQAQTEALVTDLRNLADETEALRAEQQQPAFAPGMLVRRTGPGYRGLQQGNNYRVAHVKSASTITLDGYVGWWDASQFEPVNAPPGSVVIVS